MPFGIIGQTGPGMRQVVRFGDRSAGRGTFGGEFGARHCNQWGLTFAATRPFSQLTLGRLVIYSYATNEIARIECRQYVRVPAGLLSIKTRVVTDNESKNKIRNKNKMG